MMRSHLLRVPDTFFAFFKKRVKDMPRPFVARLYVHVLRYMQRRKMHEIYTSSEDFKRCMEDLAGDFSVPLARITRVEDKKDFLEIAPIEIDIPQPFFTRAKYSGIPDSCAEEICIKACSDAVQ